MRMSLKLKSWMMLIMFVRMHGGCGWEAPGCAVVVGFSVFPFFVEGLVYSSEQWPQYTDLQVNDLSTKER
ncbi:hypothetical protein RIF29_20436 [Crotalaria pallida]|uniref:Secreted protein n=1 Tax=Crotalaria pallida TaxID=3830 RepID=A0AAN9I6B8_CROPI